MRELVEVINRMIFVIPAEESELISALMSVRSSAQFSAPESMGFHWDAGANVLARFIPKVERDWQQKVSDIWMDREVLTPNSGHLSRQMSSDK